VIRVVDHALDVHVIGLLCEVDGERQNRIIVDHKKRLGCQIIVFVVQAVQDLRVFGQDWRVQMAVPAFVILPQFDNTSIFD
jgi:hypothetical protein